MLDETRAGARTGAGNRWPHREAVVAQILLFSHAGNLEAVLGGMYECRG
jgi:hypothetical protein